MMLLDWMMIMAETKQIVENKNCLDGINTLEDNSIDLVITSPPYNVDLGKNKYKKDGYDLYFDNLNYFEYIDWLALVFKTIHPKLKPGGRIAINIGDAKNGKIPTHADLIASLNNYYHYFSTIIWDKGNTSNRAAWGSFLSPSCPSFPRSFEYICIFSKDTPKLSTKGESDLTKEEFIEWSNGLWKFPGETSKTINHPAPFPIQLPYRLIKMLSWKEATILDPFAGSGTTGVACKQLNRNFIGFEISPSYCDMANKRIICQK